MKKKRRRFHLAWDIGGAVAILTVIVSLTVHFSKQDAQIEYLKEQSSDIKVQIAEIKQMLRGCRCNG